MKPLYRPGRIVLVLAYVVFKCTFDNQITLVVVISHKRFAKSQRVVHNKERDGETEKGGEVIVYFPPLDAQHPESILKAS